MLSANELYERVAEDLKKMGYLVESVENWYHEMGAVCAILRIFDTAELIGGADPRQENWADGR